MITLLCIDPAIWVPSVAAIIAAGITAAVSFIILHKQIKNSSSEAKKDRNGVIATNKYQYKLQQLSQLDNAGIELINVINPLKLYNLEMTANLGGQNVIEYINTLGDAIENASIRYLSRVQLITPNSDNYCDSIKGAIDQYQQMLRDIQEVSRMYLQGSSTAFVDNALYQIAIKNKGDLVATIAEYARGKDTKVRTVFANLSKSIQGFYIERYKEAQESFEKDLA